MIPRICFRDSSKGFFGNFLIIPFWNWIQRNNMFENFLWILLMIFWSSKRYWQINDNKKNRSKHNKKPCRNLLNYFQCIFGRISCWIFGSFLWKTIWLITIIIVFIDEAISPWPVHLKTICILIREMTGLFYG